MSNRLMLSAVLAVSMLVCGALVGCSAGALPGDAAATKSGPAATDAPTTGAAAQKCSASGTTIPAGKYSGDITSNLVTTMHLSFPGVAPDPNAGGAVEAMDGSVHIVSNGRTVTGSIELSGTGASVVGSGAQVNSTTEGDFTGKISGPANSPIVTGTAGGAWETLDAPIQSGGSNSTPVTVGLHVTSASCGSVTGDAIAMFADIAKPVAQYITVSGTGIWTAARR